MATQVGLLTWLSRFVPLFHQPALRLFASLVTQLQFVQLVVYKKLHGPNAGLKVPVSGYEFL